MREAPAAGRRAPRDGERRREAGGSDGGGGVHLLGAADLHQASAGRRHGRARPRRVPPHVRYRRTALLCPLVFFIERYVRCRAEFSRQNQILIINRMTVQTPERAQLLTTHQPFNMGTT